MPMTNTDELIVYLNSRNGLGVRVLGAKRPTNKSGVYIKQILDDGLAQRDGRLKVGDQILSINDEITIGINREYAVNILRSAAATNQVCLHVRHFFPPYSSDEYQKFLFDEKSTDDDEENDEEIHRILNHNTSATSTNEVRMRQSSRRHQQQQHRHTAYNFSYEKKNNNEEYNLKRLDISNDALQSLLNSRFKLIDLIDLLKKTYPKLLLNNQKKELQFMQQLSETHTDGRISLKDFERQSSILLGERINLLSPFFSLSSSTTDSKSRNDNQMIMELQREISLCRSTINELQNKISTCEKSQRLSTQVEVEYEDLLKFLYEQIHQYKLNQRNQSKFIRANEQLIQKLFYYLSNNNNNKQILSELRYEYEQQQKLLSFDYQQNSNDHSIVSNNKYKQPI